MVEAGMWLSRKQRRSFHQPRLRRESYGELVQIDGSDHRWFENRASAARCWSSWTTQRAACFNCASCRVRAQTRTSKRLERTWPATAARWHFPPTRTLYLRSQAGRQGRLQYDAVRPRPGGAQHRDHLREQQAGNGSRRGPVRKRTIKHAKSGWRLESSGRG